MVNIISLCTFSLHIIMKTINKNSIHKLIATLLVISVGLFIVNNVLFLHTHKLANGRFIVHAHPYNKSQDSAPFKKHSHTSQEFFHIAHLQFLYFIGVLIALSIIVTFQKTTNTYQPSKYKFNLNFGLKGREPPLLQI